MEDSPLLPVKNISGLKYKNYLFLFLALVILGFFGWFFFSGNQRNVKPFLKVPGPQGPVSTCITRPNIIFVVADDAGWNDFSFHGSSQIPTVNFDALAFNGVILNNYYGSLMCTPTRGSILTGKHPIHIRLQHSAISGGMIGGLPLREKILPQFLKELGYATHLVGKWHLGFAREVYTPTARGFDSHYGYWGSHEDYYTHLNTEKLGTGYDFRRNMKIESDASQIYSTDLFSNEAIRILDSHPKDRPIFLMINHQAPHAGNLDPGSSHIEAPAENVNKFKESIGNIQRRIYAGMMDKLDESFGLLVEALYNNSMLENSIVIFTSDNGAFPEGFGGTAGSNWPLRGTKNSLWEGGTRLPAFIWSPSLLPKNKVSLDLMHVQDWLPTIWEAVSGNPKKLGNIDGLGQWSSLQDPNRFPVRTELLYNIDDLNNNSAVRVGPWKVINGNASILEPVELVTKLGDLWYGPSRHESENVEKLIPQILNSRTATILTRAGIVMNSSRIFQYQKDTMVNCTDENAIPCNPVLSPCLFNLYQDPCEYHNLAQNEPKILERLLALIQEYNKTATAPIDQLQYPQASPKYWNYTWVNWNDYVEV